VILAGDVNPVDVIAHIPILCEKTKMAYIFINSRKTLGAASLTKRPTSVVMILEPPSDNKCRETYDKLLEVCEILHKNDQ